MRGLIALLTGLVLISLINASRKINSSIGDRQEILKGVEIFQLSEQAIAVFLAALACFTLLVSSGPAIYFNPAESVYLLSGPFKHRDLLFYKVFSFITGLLLTGVIVALFSATRSHFLAALFGTVNAMLFIQLMSTTVSLIELKFRHQGLRHFRSVFTFFFCLGVFIVVWQMLQPIDSEIASVAQFVVSPFLIFSKTFLAPNLWPDFVLWCSVAFFANSCLVVFLALLNVDFREDVITKSQHLHSRWIKASRSGIWNDRTIRSSRVPYFLGRSPVGILIWRQTASSLRIYRSALSKLVLLALVWGPVLSLLFESSSGLSIGLSIWVCLFLLPKVISFDFRSDWDNMAALRTLPISSIRISFAQLVTPVLITSFLEGLAILTTLPLIGETGREFLIAAAALLLPLNLLIYAGDNLYFLLFPAPLTPIGRMDFEFFGRSILELIVRSILIGTTIGLSVPAAHFLDKTGMPRLAAIVLAIWTVVFCVIALTLPLMGWAFRRFPTTD